MQRNANVINILITEYLSDKDTIQWIKCNKQFTQLAKQYRFKQELDLSVIPCFMQIFYSQSESFHH